MILKTQLLPHQKAAVEKLSKIKIGALYMEMGAGKTRTALELIFQRFEADKINFVIWLCPCSVKNNLMQDIIKHVGFIPEFFRIEGIESLSSSVRLNSKLLELVTNKDCYIIVDESNLVKNHHTKRSVNIERLASNCKYKLILNGTPISRNEQDLFWQWYILDWRILGYKSFWSFSANHLEYDDYGKIRKCLNTDYLSRKIAPYSYQIKKSECLVLPDKKYETEYFYLTEWQAEHYEEIKEEYLFYLDEFKPETIYRLFTALQHIVSGRKIVSAYTRSIKTKPIFENPNNNPRIEALMYVLPKEKTIIWCKYTEEIKVIKDLLGDSAVMFFGEMNLKKRNAAIEAFRSDATYFIANKACAGYGLNLQFCNKVIYYSNDWDFATRIQSEDRVHRMGQENEVEIIDICADNTIDKRILKCLSRKEALSDSFKNSLNSLNKEGLRRWIDGVEDIQQ